MWERCSFGPPSSEANRAGSCYKDMGSTFVKVVKVEETWLARVSQIARDGFSSGS